MRVTLAIPKRDGEITLALKKYKVGAGCFNGYGGKEESKDGGDIDKTNDREFNEESCAIAVRMEKVAIIDFYEAGKHIFECHIYFCLDWVGEIEESDQMGPPKKFKIDELNTDKGPLKDMMPGDRLWLERICKGEKIRAKCYYSEGNKEVLDFISEPLEEKPL